MGKPNGWSQALGEVFSAIRADPMLLVPAILTIVVALAVVLAVMVFAR